MMKKRVLSVLLALVMVLVLLPVTAQADEVVEIDAWAGLDAALKAGGKYKLTADVTPENPYWADALTVPSGVTVTLDLNGHIVDRGYTEQGWEGSILIVSGNLTLLDSDPTATHDPAVAYTDPVTGRAITVNGGILKGGWPDQYGGGVQVQGGAVRMEGGSIACNSVGKNGFGAVAALGGGVYIQSGTFLMSGGAIVGNKASNKNTMMPDTPLGRGGAVYIANGTFTLTGGLIRGNTAGEAGGGIFMGDNGAFIMTGGTVVGNTAPGMNNFFDDSSVFSIDLAWITLNSNDGNGYVSEQTFTLNDTAPIATDIFVRDGYEFTGWNTKADGSGTPYEDGADFYAGTENIGLALYAQWRSTVVEYPLWVGGVHVTSANADDVLNDGTVKFEVTDEGENVLTLTNATITDVYEEAITERTYNVYSRDTGFALTVKPIGENSLSGAKDAISLAGALQLTGDGTLTAEASNAGISVRYGITVDGPTVKAGGIAYGVWTGGGTLSVKGTSKLTAEATGGMAIFAKTIDIDEGLSITTPTGARVGGYGEAETVYDSNIAVATKVVIEPGYLITFQNDDGTELQSGPVAVGETPVYAGETPTKAPTVEKLYTFAGWKLLGSETVLTALPAVEGEATYVAAYTESDRAYDGPAWVWTGYTKAVATFTAKDDATFTQTVTAEGEAITNAVTTQPTCTEKGERTYTATVTFLNTTYTDKAYEPIDEKGHDWDEPTYEWKAIPGGYTCTATRVCKNDTAHYESETVGSTYAVIEAPKPYVNGLGRYTSYAFENEAFAVQTKDVVIPMLRVTFVCEEINALDSYVIEDGELLYKVNVTVENLPDGVLNVDSMQLFLIYDHDLLTFVRAEGIADWTTNDYKDRLSAVWASDTDVAVKDGDVVLTLYFAALRETEADEHADLTFTLGALGDPCAVSYVNEGRVTELEAATVNGGIVFEAPLYGDANADGRITSADAALILRAVVGLSELTPRGALNADVDGDGEVTAADAVAILRWLVGLIPALPIG